MRLDLYNYGLARLTSPMRFRPLVISGFLVVSAFTSAQESVGQQQLNGIDGKFGVTYSLSNGANFCLISAGYTLSAPNSYDVMRNEVDTKMVDIQFSIKNATLSDLYLSPSDWFTLVDDKQQIYQGGPVFLESKGREANTFNLRPSQGIGQAGLKDPLHIFIKVPGKAKIDKIMLNLGRLHHDDEKVVRYNLVAPPEKATARANYIASLPPESMDPAGPWGSLLLAESKGTMGVAVPSGYFMIKPESIAPAADDAVFGGNPPEDGKRYWVGVFTVTGLVDYGFGMYDVYGGDSPTFLLTDADGEQYKPIGIRKKSTDEEPERTFKKGDTYTFRVFFAVPKAAKPNHMVYGTGSSTKWGVGISN